MANTRDIRRRIRSIQNTSQITKAMQMVAASKMRKAQQAALAGRPYAQLINRILKSGQGRVTQDAHPLLERRGGNNVCVLLITTDKGLCGALNTNLLRQAATFDTATTSFVTVGRKGKAFIARTKRNLVADFEVRDSFSFAEARSIAKFVQDLYTQKKVDRVDVLVSEFVNTLTQRPRLIQLLPVGHVPQVEDKGIGEEQPAAVEAAPAEASSYEFEPDATEVLNAILPHIVNYAMWYFLLHAKASEHSARMVAMKNATDNANQLIKDLTLEYNKIRQAGITKELLEIATAQMALG
jgi:F-type H+-transporting ATPase subunit gamma